MTGAVQLRAGDEDILVIDCESPNIISRLLRRLQKGCRIEDLMASVESEYHDDIFALLDRLLKEGFLHTGKFSEKQNEIARYLSNYSSLEQEFLTSHSQMRILVVAQSASGQLMADALGEYGFSVSMEEDGRILHDSTQDTPSVVACIWEQPNLSMAIDINSEICRSRTPCLFIDLSHGRHATVGPFYVPNESACYQCFRSRWRENTTDAAEFDAAEVVKRDPRAKLPSFGMLPGSRYHVVGLSCSEIFAFFSRHRPLRTLNRIATVDLEGARTWTEPCWRIPWCPACGAE